MNERRETATIPSFEILKVDTFVFALIVEIDTIADTVEDAGTVGKWSSNDRC